MGDDLDLAAGLLDVDVLLYHDPHDTAAHEVVVRLAIESPPDAQGVAILLGATESRRLAMILSAAADHADSVAASQAAG